MVLEAFLPSSSSPAKAKKRAFSSFTKVLPGSNIIYHCFRCFLNVFSIDYALPRTEQAFISFLNEQCGTQRAPGGGLTALAGRLPSFDKLAQNFLDAGKSTKDELLSQAKKLAADVNDQAAAIYVRVFEKIYGDESYVQKELERIQKLLSKKSTLASQKVDDLQVKQNSQCFFRLLHLRLSAELTYLSVSVLQAFESSKEKAEDVKEKVKEEL